MKSHALIDRKPLLWIIPAFLLGFGMALLLCTPGAEVFFSGDDDTISGYQQCYYREIPVQEGVDRLLVAVTPLGPGTYTGIYNSVPAGRDSLRGFWHGEAIHTGDSYTIDALSTISDEGQIVSQQQSFRVNNDTLEVGYGEVHQVNNIYVYKDLAGLSFDTVLSRIDCRDVPVEAW